MITKNYEKLLSPEGLIIFLFHGVINRNPYTVRNYNRKHIDKLDFYNLLKSLKASGNPINLDQYMKSKYLKKNSFVITFDDGFENNASIAAPILEELNIPATFYITSAFVDKNLMSWVDQLEHCIEHTSKKKIDVFGRQFILKDVESKIICLDWLRNFFKTDKNVFLKKSTKIRELFDTCEVKFVESQENELDKKMSWLQAKHLSKNPLFTIGGHTHNHEILSYLNGNVLDYEINECLKLIDIHCNQKTKHFSYPEGLKYCFDQRVIKALVKAGVSCCPTAEQGINRRHDNLFYLKRVPVT